MSVPMSEEQITLWAIQQCSAYIPELSAAKPDFNPRILYDALMATIHDIGADIEVPYDGFYAGVGAFLSTSGSTTEKMNAVMTVLGLPEESHAFTLMYVRAQREIPIQPAVFMTGCADDGIPPEVIQAISERTGIIRNYAAFKSIPPKPPAEPKPISRPAGAGAKKTTPPSPPVIESKLETSVTHNEQAITMPIIIPDLNRLLIELQRFVLDNSDELYNALTLAVYKGFNREAILSEAFRTLSAQSTFVISAVTALRGPRAVKTSADIQAIRVSDKSGRSISIAELFTQGLLKEERATFKKGGRDLAANELTAGRICAAFPDMAAYGLYLLWKRGGLSKRMDVPCPAFLQFPQAASLPMTESGRAQHVDFSKRFSDEALKPAGGSFNKNIYAQQSRNTVSLDNHLGRILVDDSNSVLTTGRNHPYTASEGASESKASEK